MWFVKKLSGYAARQKICWRFFLFLFLFFYLTAISENFIFRSKNFVLMSNEQTHFKKKIVRARIYGLFSLRQFKLTLRSGGRI